VGDVMFGWTEKYKTKSGVHWRACYRDASSTKVSKGGFQRETDAKLFLRDIAAGLKGGSTKNVSFLIEEYLSAKRRLVEQGGLELCTFDLYRGHLYNYVKTDEIAYARLGDLGTGDINKFLSRLLERTSHKNAKRIRVSFSTMLRWAVGQELIRFNPARDARFEGNFDRACAASVDDWDDVDVDGVKIPTPNQVRALFAAAASLDATRKTEAMLRLLFHGGLRPSEMLGIPAKLVRSTPDGRMEIKIAQRADAKTGKIGKLKTTGSLRKITISKDAAQIVREYIAASGIREGLLFQSKSGGVMHYRNFHRRTWLPVLGACGFASKKTITRREGRSSGARGARSIIGDWSYETTEWSEGQFTPHHGRHFAASSMIASGAKPKAVQKFLGHATLAVTMDIYGHLFPDEARDSQMADAIEKMLA